MEELNLESGRIGQQYGFIVYKLMNASTEGTVLRARGHIRDMAYVLVDGSIVNEPYKVPDDLNKFGFWVKR